MDFTRFVNIVDGKKRLSKTSRRGINPATGENLWEVPCASEQDVDDAVHVARRIFPAWARTPYEERCRSVRQFADALLKYETEFTELLMREVGKPRSLANREVKSAHECIVGATTFTLPVEDIEDDVKSVRVTHVSMGVVGAICPWNYPFLLSLTKVAPALVTGNCIIVKPSPFTPYTALKAIEIGQSFFPPGVLQVLGGDDQLGPWIVDHPNIQKISFTGSVATGKKIMEAAAKSLKKVTLELGGNDPVIVRQDVDIAKTAPEVALSAFKNTGQICVASKRILVHEDIYEPFLEAMTDYTKTLKVGDPFENDVDLGPIQNRMQYEKVQEFFDDCTKRNYKFTTGGQDHMTNGFVAKKGYFIHPTIIAGPPLTSKIVTEEPFGPIVPVISYSSDEEAIRMANDTRYGLGACVWSKDLQSAQQIATKLEVGSVFINSSLRPDWRVFFSGRKDSGIGGERGLRGLLDYCDTLAVHTYK